MTNVTPTKAAFLARKAGPPQRADGLIETAGVPWGYTGKEETEEILADPDTLEAIEEAEADLESGDVHELTIDDEILELGGTEDPESGEVSMEDYLAARTIPELHEIAEGRSIHIPSKANKADIIELLLTSEDD